MVAENVHPEEQLLTGTVEQSNGKFGFILQATHPNGQPPNVQKSLRYLGIC